MERLPYEEFVELTRELELHHSIFYKLWKFGEVAFDDVITETACIQWDEKGESCIFLFNPKYWDSLDHYSRLFVICHEMLHVILFHGKRILELQPQLANIAVDIVVNHMLVKGYGFDRAQVKDADNYCWVDTVFPGETPTDPPTALYDQNFEYYYTLLMKELAAMAGSGMSGSGSGTSGSGTSGGGANSDESGEGEGEGDGDGSGEGEGKGNGRQLVDDHQGLVPPDDFAKNFVKDFTPEDGKALEGMVQGEPQQNAEAGDSGTSGNASGGAPGGNGRGDAALGMWIPVLVKHVEKKKKWETIIKKWLEKAYKQTEKDEDQWARISRRGYNLPRELMLPSEYEVDTIAEDEDKIEVWFFLDASGSCYNYANRFFKAAKSVPEEKFTVRLFSFDTRIYELDIKHPKMRGGGGTSFHIMENYIQNKIKTDKIKYPAVVFVITDGVGTRVEPEHPSRWCILLVGGGWKYGFPNECHDYQLREFE